MYEINIITMDPSSPAPIWSPDPDIELELLQMARVQMDAFLAHAQRGLQDQRDQSIQGISEIQQMLSVIHGDPVPEPPPPPPIHPVSITIHSVEDHNNAVRKLQNMIDSVSSGDSFTLNEGDYLELSGVLGKMYISSS
jgi:hypothetical protein